MRASPDRGIDLEAALAFVYADHVPTLTDWASMRAHTCPECEFVYLGDDPPDEGCPECGIVWSPVIVPPPDLNTDEELNSTSMPQANRELDGAPPTYVGPLISGVLIGALLIAIPGYALRHWLFPAEQSDSYRQLQTRAEGMETARNMAQDRLQVLASRLVAAQHERDELQQKYETSESDRLRLEHVVEQSAAALAALRRNSGDSYLHQWQVLGPLPWENDQTPVRIEVEPLNLTREYKGHSGKIRWMPVESTEPQLNLANVLASKDKLACYAVCWVESERDRDVLLSLGSDDGMAVWINRVKFHEFTGHRPARAGEDEVKARLNRGWNEVLVRVDNKGGADWALFFELKDPRNKRPLKVFSTYVPQGNSASTE